MKISTLKILSIELAVLVSLVMVVDRAEGNSCAPQPSGLVGWWAGEGNAVDQISGNNGTLVGNASYGPGEVGQAFVFDGVSGGVLLGNPASLQLQNFTIEAWIKRASTTTVSLTAPNAWLFGYNNNGYGFGLWNDGRLYLTKAGVDSIEVSTGITDINLHHVAITKNGSTVIFYVDGVGYQPLVYNQVFSFTTSLGIGYIPGSAASSFLGLIDEMSVYNRALTAAEIQAIYNAGDAGKCSTPVVPVVTSQPTNLTVVVGRPASFTVSASGTPPLRYQWRFNGTNILGATNTVLLLPSAQFADSGAYSVTIRNVATSVLSSNALLTVLPPPPCFPAPTGLVGWWRGESNTLDSIGGNNGSFLGSASYTYGEVGNALSFDGVNSGVLVPASANLNVGAGNGMTIEAWVNPSEITPGGKANPVVEWNGGSGYNYGSAFWLTHPSVAIGNFFANLVDTGGGNHVIFSNSGLITTNVYQHIAVTYDKASGTAALYYNGGQVAVDTTFGAFTPQTTYPLYFGKRPPGDVNSWVFSGSLDEVSIYNRALSANEIASIYQAGSGGKCKPVPPAISSQPSGQTVLVGGLATFSVAAVSQYPMSYQWRFNQANLLGATNAILTLLGVTTNQAGLYSVTITNQAGHVASSNAVLSVFPSALSFLNGAALSAGHHLQFTVAGVPGFRYAVQTSTNLINWSWRVTNTAPFDFNDTNVLGLEPQFYRTVYLP